MFKASLQNYSSKFLVNMSIRAELKKPKKKSHFSKFWLAKSSSSFFLFFSFFFFPFFLCVCVSNKLTILSTKYCKASFAK